MEITYLLGAGASAKKVPVVSEMDESFKALLKTIKSANIKDEIINENLNPELTTHKMRSIFIEDFSDLIEESKIHASIDTYAKKLFLTGSAKFIKTKAIMDLFFTYWQVINGLDNRYDAFLASILKGGGDLQISFPNNIKILTWNYDLQFELSCSNYYLDVPFDNLLPKFDIFPNRISNTNDPDKFAFVKINGSATSRLKNSKYETLILDIKNKKEAMKNVDKNKVLEILLKDYYWTLNSKDYEPGLSFAWEKNQVSLSTRQTARELIQKSHILVVIGYSFPTFNREIDQSLLDSMPNLHKVIIQSQPDTVGSIVERFNDLWKKFKNMGVVIPYSAVNEFYIPTEL